MPQKSFVILGISHRVQGDADFINAVDDPVYKEVVSEIISKDHIDFVGEECSVNSTDAERITQKLLGIGSYLSVDPVLEEDRRKCSIGETCLPRPLTALPVERWVVSENEKREKIWIDLLIEKTDTKGLLICGFYHAFSVAAKLLDRGFEVEARTYIPWEKLGLNVGRKWGQA
ncbi:MAG: hypothetical protein WCE61_21240 [Candidatus Acidiferrum sp.]